MSSVPGIRSDFFVMPLSIVELCIERQRPAKSSLRNFRIPATPAASPNIVLYPRVLSLKFAIEIRHRDLLSLRLAWEQTLKLTATHLRLAILETNASFSASGPTLLSPQP